MFNRKLVMLSGTWRTRLGCSLIGCCVWVEAADWLTALPCAFERRRERKEIVATGCIFKDHKLIVQVIGFCHEESNAVCERNLHKWKGELREVKR